MTTTTPRGSTDYHTLESELTALIPEMRFSKEINMKLERITHLLALLGNPHDRFPSIHVGGTSGKGSTATMTAAILSAVGRKTGLHLSPYLQILNEQYQIDGRMVSASELLSIYQTIKPALDEVASTNPFGRPSYFETQVAMAFCLFRQSNVDVAVIEVGLGGTLDATNVINARVAVLTNIGLDHTDILGDSVELIAADKAGIIKPNQVVISGLTQPSTQQIVADRCTAKGAHLWQLGQRFTYHHRQSSGRLSVRIGDISYRDLVLGMVGDFQALNASCAVAAAHAFAGELPLSAISTGLREARVPGRMEIIQQGPVVILDGAHNSDKMRAAAEAMRRNFPGRDRVVVLALKDDKPWHDILPFALENARMVIVTTFRGEKRLGRSHEPTELAAAARGVAPNSDVRVQPDPLCAIKEAIQEAREDVVWVTGSLYLIGDVREYWYPAEGILASLG